MATLKEKDFAHGVINILVAAQTKDDAETQYRTLVMTLMHQPLIGWKRGKPAVNAPARLFLLSSIENGDKPAALKEARTVAYRIEPVEPRSPRESQHEKEAPERAP